MAKIAQYAYIHEDKFAAGTKHGVLRFPDSEMVDTDLLTLVYRKLELDYPKFFKMDRLAKTGFVASELVMQNSPAINEMERENTAVIFFNRLASLDTDRKFENTIADSGNCFPSPSLFVYTLPNIVTGEICIRNRFKGESSFYVCERFDPQQMSDIVGDALKYSSNVLTAWYDCVNSHIQSVMFLITKSGNEKMQNFNADNLRYIYNKIFINR